MDIQDRVDAVEVENILSINHAYALGIGSPACLK